MSIDSALYTRMAGFAGLAALVSTRIYPPPIPQNATYPLLTYMQISGVRPYVYGNQTEFCQARFQVDSWAQTSIAVRAVAEQVRLALSNYKGTSDGVVIDLVEILNEQRLYDDEALLHRDIMDFMVTFREAIPA